MKYRRLILSTGNTNKVKEIKDIIKDLPITVLSKDDVNIKDIHVDEDGKTLEANAIKKAKVLAERVEGMVMADDSGLFVDCLGGGKIPGVHSARYAGDKATDKENNDKLLVDLKGRPLEQRGARFQAVIVLILEDGNIVRVKGECKGRIGFQSKGNQGFGYAPLFIPDGYDKTFAELGEDVKNKISHRARALDKLKTKIINIIEEDADENIRGK